MKSTTFATESLSHVFLNTAITLIGDAGGLLPSGAAGNLHLSLHTAWPGTGADQTTSEATFSGYGRAAVARNGTQWTVAAGAAENLALIQFPECNGPVSSVVAFVGVGASASGAGKLLYRTPIGADVAGRYFAAFSATEILTVPGHAFVVGNRVVVLGVAGATLPAGLTEGTIYWVKTVSGDDITLSATQGGATIDLTSAGAGRMHKCTPVTVEETMQVQFQVGRMKFFEN